MRCTENYARQDLSVRAMPKKTHRVMPMNQRIVLEALRRRGHSTIGAVADELDKSRDATKHVFITLIRQGYIEQTRKSEAKKGNGRAPAIYRWTGKTFPSSAEITSKVEQEARAVSEAITVLFAAMHAMCRIGRLAA
ncbi:hypothetical protein AWB70_01038 [Caballeronia cordobensis]|uniref:Uncharacterized protein n=1 Tax=Caballeronia cordobensis TaxID=1353886 RepID=A0A158FKG4_CABCO|nr:hypothetical protein [Caballeronia cordobensis]SAL20406.1 hypothetical protein AWB70_01038 [Caballeronia cordobensis]